MIICKLLIKICLGNACDLKTLNYGEWSELESYSLFSIYLEKMENLVSMMILLFPKHFLSQIRFISGKIKQSCDNISRNIL